MSKTLEKLREMEWQMAETPEGVGLCCVICRRRKVQGHDPDCLLAQAITEAEEGGWVRVEDELPEINKYGNTADVWIYGKGYSGDIGYYHKTRGWCVYNSYEKREAYQERITHWKPRIPPKETK